MACHPSKCVKACPPAPAKKKQPKKPNKFINLAGHLIVTKLHECIKSKTPKFQLPFSYSVNGHKGDGTYIYYFAEGYGQAASMLNAKLSSAFAVSSLIRRPNVFYDTVF